MRRALLLVLFAAGCQEYEFTPYEGVDVFFQDPPGKVDVLVVMDNSGSMAGWQLLVGARFHDFMTWLVEADVDYHVAVTTTTIDRPYPAQGCSQAEVDAMPVGGAIKGGVVITPDTIDAEGVFIELANVGTCGSGDERGLEAARLALSPELLAGANAGFVRDDAKLSLVFVSDEQDASPDAVHDYTNAYFAAAGLDTRDAVNAHALVITNTDECIVGIGGSSPGTRYAAVAEATAGVVGNLCNTDFTATAEEISLRASRLRDTFYLSEWPGPATLQVSVGDEIVPCDRGAWTYQRVVDEDGEERPAIVFHRDEMPVASQQIVARYGLGSGDPSEACPPEEVE